MLHGRMKSRNSKAVDTWFTAIAAIAFAIAGAGLVYVMVSAAYGV
jgi:hypothetical protein